MIKFFHNFPFVQHKCCTTMIKHKLRTNEMTGSVSLFKNLFTIPELYFQVITTIFICWIFICEWMTTRSNIFKYFEIYILLSDYWLIYTTVFLIIFWNNFKKQYFKYFQIYIVRSDYWLIYTTVFLFIFWNNFRKQYLDKLVYNTYF